ncbi:FAD-binding oxidoreductase [Amycolatopsis sp. CA-128772]|uniref:NAD(P)/FAD-dependent oxidoreductase n=1 Tax=Amycolatopsis sp. CA-128772 TaxID=2073159 RepID=UPI000CD20BD5|nr:FAD-binding oxidoreductase [Amycolatopsis sp. CA-128772]
MTDVDVAVVGGGIIGCLVARELTARAPGRTVTVLDRGLVGSGASRWSAGLHFPRGATRRVRAMAAAGQDAYERLKAEDPALPIHPLGLCVLSSDAAGVARAYLERAHLTPAREVPGTLPVPAGTGIWTGEGCHHADVGALAAALARRLRPRVRFREGVAVAGIERGDREVTLRLGTGEPLTAAAVVLAPGPWVHAPAWRSLTRPLELRVKLVAALHVDRVPGEGDPVVVFHDPDAFLLPLAHRGHWMFSFTSRQWDVRPDALTDGLTGATLAEGREALAACAPELAGAVTAGRVFCDAYSPRREPVVRTLDDDGRIVFAGAANGSGYRLAPAIAAEAADLIFSGPAQRISA